MGKDLSMELLKFIALIIIANSHMDVLYGDYSILATGGSIGDALFFFCSGFTLFLGRMDRFDNWYKRRIYRIYPSVIAWALVASTFFGIGFNMKEIVLQGGGWFVSCIMIYYLILFFVRKYLFDKKEIAFILSMFVILIWYLFEDASEFFMYGNTYFKWGHYFLFMLLGAFIGAKKINIHINTKKDLIFCVGNLVLYYVMMFLCSKNSLAAELQILTLFPLAGIIVSLYNLCNSSFANRFMEKYTRFICAISSLCLESYLVQNVLFTDKLNSIFPFNLIIIMILILILAYLVRTLGRIIVQLFNRDNFNWKAIWAI